MLLRTFQLSALALGVLTLPAQAELLNADWHSPNDRLITQDTETGLEWLDLSQTNGMSIAVVQAHLDTTFAGWRLPSRSEVTGLMNSALGDEGNTPFKVDQHHAYFGRFERQQLSSVRNQFGDTGGRSYGLYLNDQPELGGAEVLWSGIYGDDWAYHNSDFWADSNSAASGWGVFLVKGEAAVPGPLGIGLLSLGLLGLAGRRELVTK